MSETVTPKSGRTGPVGHHHATLQHQGLLQLAGFDNRELPRGPSFMPQHRSTHPNQHPVRSTPATRADREQAVTVALRAPLRTARGQKKEGKGRAYGSIHRDEKNAFHGYGSASGAVVRCPWSIASTYRACPCIGSPFSRRRMTARLRPVPGPGCESKTSSASGATDADSPRASCWRATHHRA